ncbi:UDP-glucose 6-dehydrogenase AglM [uncultured archaeon]|nr:UDP-glucose 6-dehydrogenase AglM [uncultured archaeon]
MKGAKVALLGLAFKEDTDDVRESPAITIAEDFFKAQAKVTAYDKKAVENAKKILGEKISYATSVDEALKDADLAVVATGWKQFATLNVHVMKKKRVLDTRHVVKKNLLPKDTEYEGLLW